MDGQSLDATIHRKLMRVPTKEIDFSFTDCT